jgi:chromosome segregation ATPase
MTTEPKSYLERLTDAEQKVEEKNHVIDSQKRNIEFVAKANRKQVVRIQELEAENKAAWEALGDACETVKGLAEELEEVKTVRDVLGKKHNDIVDERNQYCDRYLKLLEKIYAFLKWWKTAPESVIDKKIAETFDLTETEKILLDKSLMEKIRKARKESGGSSPYQSLGVKG